MALRIFFLLLIFFASQSCFSQNWIYVGKSGKGDTWYLRNITTSDYGNKKVWSKRLAKSITYQKRGKFYTMINGYCLELREYDCSGKQSKLLSLAYYNSTGSVVHSFRLQDYETDWDDVLPDSIGETLLNKFCFLFKILF